MIKSEFKKLVDGVWRTIQKVVYSDGSAVERLMGVNNVMPEAVTFIDKNGNREEGF